MGLPNASRLALGRHHAADRAPGNLLARWDTGWYLGIVFLWLTVVPPLFMGGFLSMGRVTATLFPVFIYLGTRLTPAATPHVLLVSFGLQVVLAVLHFTWRQVY